jgi:hypothetical protein
MSDRSPDFSSFFYPIGMKRRRPHGPRLFEEKFAAFRATEFLRFKAVPFRREWFTTRGQ